MNTNGYARIHFLINERIRKMMLLLIVALLSMSLSALPRRHRKVVHHTAAITNTILLFCKQGSALPLNRYPLNRIKYNSLNVLIKKYHSDLLSGNAYMQITTYGKLGKADTLPMNINNSQYAILVRRLVGVNSLFGGVYFNFDHNLKPLNYVKITCVHAPINKDTGVKSFFLLDKNLTDLVRYKMPDTVHKKLPLKDTLNVYRDSIKTSLPKPTISSLKTDDRQVQQKSFAGVGTKISHTVFCPFIAIKTNLFYWAGFTSEPRYRNITPNLELEYYFKDRFSVDADFSYTYINKNNPSKKTWGVSGVGAEPRYWFCTPGRFSGLYAGLYGLYGSFDVKGKGDTSLGNTGTFYEGGISLGWLISITRHWGIEIGGRTGYRSSSGDIYKMISTKPINTNSFKQNGIKLTGIRVNITYRFGKSKIQKSLHNEKSLKK